MKKISAWDLLWSGLKLNFLQASWNFERLQNAGFLFSIRNILRKIYDKDPQGFAGALKRHIGFFNTHIFFSSAALGVIARLEETVSNNDPQAKEREIENTKMGIMGPLAAIGDSLFWSGIKPFALLIGVVIVMLGGTAKPGLWIWAVLTAFVIYNVPKVAIKYFLLFKAYYQHQQLFGLIQRIKFQDILKSIKITGMGILGMFTAVYAATDEYFVASHFVDSLLLAGVFFITVSALKRKVSVSRILMVLMVVCIIIAYIF
ncbi:MAG TPA: PTS system mannose/fructose/sorbose family transporter subunit IID [Candidatus Goldiibacteriota bacterium]|nr:PTS system mannose/fructose/sorbose family transporter subunit IID [Candidatus Goldiibacteriota bacterium]HPN64683.1 PTS system mannose/fructose/sorbose family transporter subunit IID [Candidatus Goldiibacteriota bacterium]HRQ43752.1 PTS system mannose/fructose/sorbose family transporter subunit IID [Candidatus Goldiibacteriota bacterium]